MEQNMESAKLLFSFVVDNGTSMKDGKMAQLMPAFRAFAEKMSRESDVEFELVAFDALAPTVVKSFTSPDIAPVAVGRMPLLGRAITTAGARLSEREAELKKQGREVYLPWLFILSDGLCLDGMESAVAQLEGAERAGQLMYLPFRLCEKLLSEPLFDLDRTKHMIEILPGHIAEFFDFVGRMVELRRTLPVQEPMKFSKTDFEGWAVL